MCPSFTYITMKAVELKASFNKGDILFSVYNLLSDFPAKMTDVVDHFGLHIC